MATDPVAQQVIWMAVEHCHVGRTEYVRHSDNDRKKDSPIQLAVVVLRNTGVGILSSGWEDEKSRQTHVLAGSRHPKLRTVV